MSPVPADPSVLHPIPEQPRVVLLKPLVTSPLIEVGEYSYYDDPDEPTAFETRNVIRSRYSEPDITRLLTLAWWNWPVEHLSQHLRTIMSGSIDDLEAVAPA